MKSVMSAVAGTNEKLAMPEGFNAHQRFPGLAYLDSLPLWDGKRRFGLEIPRKIFSALHDPQDAVTAIHVTGTNGKGSVSAMLSSMLLKQGSSVGQYASPHLTSVVERCIVNGHPVSESFFDTCLVEVVNTAARLGLSLSYFELSTAASVLAFARQRLDWMIIEVGLGGRLDATNTMRKPAACVLTNIGLDHVVVLGNSHYSIAWEKAHIARRDVPFVVGPLDRDSERAVREVTNRAGACASVFGAEWKYDERHRVVEGFGRSIPFRPDEVALKGAHQLENSLVAVATAAALGFSEATIHAGLRQAAWPGRLESFCVDRADMTRVEVLFDVAHNPPGMRALVDYVMSQLNSRNFAEVQVLFSVLDRKDAAGMFAELKRLYDFSRARNVGMTVTFTASDHPQAIPSEVLLQVFAGVESSGALGAGVVAIADSKRALGQLIGSSKAGGLVIVTGSLFLVGMLRTQITSKPFSTHVRDS